MPSQLPTTPLDAADRYHGFSLYRVGWGHRKLFERLLENLFERGLLGPPRQAATATVFSLLRQADQGSYDPVLRCFLRALNPRTEWLLDVPALFAAVVDLGRELATSQPHRGVVFFTLLAEDGLGESPAAVRQALALARRLQSVDPDLALAFLQNYARLAERLHPPDLERFVDAGLAAFARNPASGLAFIRCSLESSEAFVRDLAQECRLQDVQESLRALTCALAGGDVGVADLGSLPAEDVAGRGCRCVFLGRTLYLPAQIRTAPTRQRNQHGYTLAAVVAAGALRFDSFSRIHGHPRYLTLRGLAGDAPVALNALLLAEWHRLLSGCADAWPGLRRLLQAGLEQDLAPALAADGAAAIVRRLLLGGVGDLPEPVARLAESARLCRSVFHTAALLTPTRLAELQRACPELAGALLPPLSFMPDFLFPARETNPQAERAVAEWRKAAVGDKPDSAHAPAVQTAKPALAELVTPSSTDYVYDEWSCTENDYRRAYCCVQETVPVAPPDALLPADLAAEGRRLRRAFERLKPDSVRREKYLREGDEIAVDRLIHFLMQRGADPAPRVDFYEKPRLSRRDVAVLVLLDLSGSTGEMTPAGERILDLERRAAMVLGQGLEALGDRFAVCGFHSNGPRQCAFLVFKDFAERWEHAAVARLLAAVPAHRTRIGPALRHAGWRLASSPCRQRLILLITDGRPLDTDYDPATHYGHHDVRKACEENARLKIHTFAVSTAESSVAEMEIMFPDRRFVILSDLRQLPHVLPAVYSRLTL